MNTKLEGGGEPKFVIEGKVALITGVSSGIGREIAQVLAQRGARVFGTVRKLSETNAIEHVELVCMDVTYEASVKEAVKSVLEKAGRIDILVNNAGYSLAGGLEETSIEEARQLFDTNFFGVLRVTQAVLASMRQHGYGRIVNISSMLGVLPGPYRGMYAASKHALEGYTKTLDHEVRTFGIRAALVEPVYTKTKITANEKNVQTSIPAYADQKKRVTVISLRLFRQRYKRKHIAAARKVAEGMIRSESEKKLDEEMKDASGYGSEIKTMRPNDLNDVQRDKDALSLKDGDEPTVINDPSVQRAISACEKAIREASTDGEHKALEDYLRKLKSEENFSMSL
jgi:NAD(P)-dependent dehydrogenase (short-subunit alcohol dehydrogenase family)